MTRDIYIDPDVEGAHQRVVALSKEGKFELARDQASETMREIETSYSQQDWQSRDLHLARLERDIAFISVRQVAKAGSGDLWWSREYLKSSRAHTDLLLLELHADADTTNESWRLVNAEHGATVSILGRLTVVRALVGQAEVSNYELYKARAIFDTADSYLQEGSNRYYRTSNLLHSARAEVLLGDRKESLRQYLKAGRIAVSAVAVDPDNLRASVMTFGSYSRYILASSETARQSVLAKP